MAASGGVVEWETVVEEGDAEAWREHGGRLDLAERRFPHAPRPWIDLSTGINPSSWSGVAPPADLRALPSPTALRGLEATAAAMFGIAPERVAALPGSEAGLRALAGLPLPGPYRYVAPSYGTHGAIWQGGRPVAAHDLDAAADDGGTLLLANPNNPDGAILSPDRLLGLSERLRARGGWLVVDEAFADAAAGISLGPHLGGAEPVLVLRSFGKFFGLAGIRLGFLCGPSAALAMVRERFGAWPVSAQAIAVGTAAYHDRAWIADMRERLPARAAALDAVLRRHGLRPIGDCPLFRLVETPGAPALFERLAEAGILTRPFAGRPWLRFGLPGDRSALARLDRALGG